MFGALSTVLGAAAEASASRWAARAAPAAASSSRAMSTVHLGNLAPAKGSSKVNMRRGRGQGSTKGGTAGRGHKGQLARSGNGKPVPGFEGGQTPITRLFPKRGFLNFTRRTFAPLSLARLQSLLADGRIDAALPISVGTLVRANAVHGVSGDAGIKLLGPADPDLPLPPLDLTLSRFSKSAARAVTDAGGKISAVYHNNLSLRQEVWPEKFIGRDVREARPIRRADIEYYSNPKTHGYLAKEAAEAPKPEPTQ